jgi:hypothetical protein
MFIAGEARLSAELSRKQSNFFSISYDERPEACSSVYTRTFHFQIPPPMCGIKKHESIYEITLRHPFDPANRRSAEKDGKFVIPTPGTCK